MASWSQRWCIIGVFGCFAIGCSNKVNNVNPDPLARFTLHDSCTSRADTTVYADKPATAHIIPYKISAHMWHTPVLGTQGTLIDTPVAIISKIQKSGDLWNSVSSANVKLQYAGTYSEQYNTIADLPSDGTLYIALNSNDNSLAWDESGLGGYTGTIPGDYQNGIVMMNTQASLAHLKLYDITHEIGHALGLWHVTTNDTAMHCGTPTWGEDEFLALGEQDRVNLTFMWPFVATKLYSIAGTVTVSDTRNSLAVFAVNVENGRTFSTRVDNSSLEQKPYTIPVGVAGRYRVFAKESSEETQTLVNTVPSWYIDVNHATNLPYAGKVLSLDDVTPTMTAIDIKVIKKDVPFNFFVTGNPDHFSFSHSFLRPGGTGGIVQFIFNTVFNVGEPIMLIAPYGEQPDYTISSDISVVSSAAGGSTPAVTIAACPGAAPGHRLALARSTDGYIQAGLVGIHIVKNTYPSFIDNRKLFPDADQVGWIQGQIDTSYDFSQMNENYWKE